MHRKIRLIGVLLLILVSIVSPLSIGLEIYQQAGRNTLYVGGSGPGNYTSIKDAIIDAKFGDTVYVYDDSSPYYERLVINKKIDLIGENKDTTIIDGQEEGTVIHIRVRGVTIRCFTIKGCKHEPLEHYGGIRISSNHNRIIDNNVVENEGEGILVDICTRNNIISENNISNNSIGGILLNHFSNNNIITKNIITNNTDFFSVAGIWGGYYTINNKIEENYIAHNYRGIILSGNRNRITENIFLGNGGGIELGGFFQIVNKNVIFDNSGTGINLRHTRFTRIKNNNITGSKYGIILLAADSNLIIDNTIAENYDGIRVYSQCDRNIIENNDIRSNSHDGILLQYAGFKNIISNNNIGSNQRDGIHSWISQGNIYSYNNISSNHRNGICFLNYSNNSIIRGNTISNNYKYGIVLANSSLFNTIYFNNFINNGIQAFDEDINKCNYWYQIILLRGNYWSDYIGEDNLWPFGIGDIPYEIPKNSKDKAPLMERLNGDLV